MMYEISPQMRILAIKLENERRQKLKDESGALNSTQTKTSTTQESGRGEWREELDYREGFKWPHNKNYETRHY
jgi:hypothetical protein